MTDPLAAELTRIQESAEALTASHADEDCAGDYPCTGHDALRLVAAVERVLDLHKPDGYSMEIKPCERHSVTRTDLPAADLAEAQRACPDCRVTEYVRCWQHGCPGPWPCPTYSALAGELLSKEDRDAGCQLTLGGALGDDGTCPSCGSPDRAERAYVPGATGMPVDCSSDWHGDDARGPGDA